MEIRRQIVIAALGVAALLPAMGLVASARTGHGPVSPLLNRTVPDVDGKPVNLARYQGKVLLIVNTASLCGNTPQYAALEQLYEKYKGRGFTILAFPANDFGHQEPGSNAEIKDFCTSKYHVSFPVFSKIAVKGDQKHPLYRYLTEPTTGGKFAGEIEWNFAKFLVNRKGEVVARFPAGHKPDSTDVVDAIEHELAEKA